MGVKKIFTTLITVVGCVIVGAFVLNVLLPNVTSGLVNAVEDMVYKSTGISFDFNGDSNMGSNDTSHSAEQNNDITTNYVEGFN